MRQSSDDARGSSPAEDPRGRSRRWSRTAVELSLALGLLLCGLSTSALGAEFGATPEAKVRGASGTEGQELLTLGAFQVQCLAAHGKGALGSGPQVTELTISLRLSGCSADVDLGGEPVVLKASVKAAVPLSYRADGTAAIGGLKVDLSKLGCEIEVGVSAQSGGAGAGKFYDGLATYSNQTIPTTRLRLFPSGFREVMGIATEVEELPVSFHGTCGELARTSDGSFTGTSWYEAAGGNLGWFSEEGEWSKLKN